MKLRRLNLLGSWYRSESKCTSASSSGDFVAWCSTYFYTNSLINMFHTYLHWLKLMDYDVSWHPWMREHQDTIQPWNMEGICLWYKIITDLYLWFLEIQTILAQVCRIGLTSSLLDFTSNPRTDPVVDKGRASLGPNCRWRGWVSDPGSRSGGPRVISLRGPPLQLLPYYNRIWKRVGLYCTSHQGTPHKKLRSRFLIFRFL